MIRYIVLATEVHPNATEAQIEAVTRLFVSEATRARVLPADHLLFDFRHEDGKMEPIGEHWFK